MRSRLAAVIRRIRLLFCLMAVLPLCAEASGTEAWAALSNADRDFLETLEARTFAFFWETTNPENGLAPDRWPDTRSSSVAATGFGLTAYCVGVERGYITRDQAIERVLSTFHFLRDAPQSDDPSAASGYRGFFYHFLEIDSGRRYHQRELSSIDTAWLMAGVLACREYFNGTNPREAEIRELADRLYCRVEWNWMQPRAPLICMSWHPEEGFGEHDYKGYNEAMMLYLLALGSPTHPVDAAAWDAYTSTYLWADFYGQEQVNFTPLFGHQFSHAWIDFRKIQDRYMRDKGIDYFENSRRATVSQRDYAIANPSGWQNYGAEFWGLTSCDGPGNKTLPFEGRAQRFHSYWPRGASARGIRDDGTVAPAAAAGSIPFAPKIVVVALRSMHERYNDKLFAQYGFLDSVNPSFTFADEILTHGHVDKELGWINSYYLGIDQGPIILMIENFRSEMIWKLMKRSPHIERGLQRAGFSGGWLNRRK